MNICMVGYGAIAKCHMEAFTSIDGVRPYRLVGRRAEPTSQFAQQWGFEQHGLDLDEAVQDPQVDAVVVTSPNELHVSQATTALEAGKHLLLEIPIAMNLADAQQVTNLSRQLNRRLMICHTLRFQPGLVEIRRRVEAEQFHLHHFFAMFGILRRENTNMYGKPRSWTDNILWHHGAHLVDLAIWISGCDQPTNVDCRFGPLHPRQGVMDMSLTMSLDGGVPATICQSYNIHTFHWRATFIGEEDTLYWNEGELSTAAGKIIIPRADHTDLSVQNREFIAAIREDRDPAITGEAVLPCMAVLEQAQARADATG